MLSSSPTFKPTAIRLEIAQRGFFLHLRGWQHPRRPALQFRYPGVVALPTNMTLAKAVENVLPPINNLFAHAVGDAPRQVVISVAFPQTYTGGAETAAEAIGTHQ
jgi:hypothetical protein